jgi:hypothetical protein
MNIKSWGWNPERSVAPESDASGYTGMWVRPPWTSVRRKRRGVGRPSTCETNPKVRGIVPVCVAGSTAYFAASPASLSGLPRSERSAGHTCSKILATTRSSSGCTKSFSQRSLSRREAGRIGPFWRYCSKYWTCSLSAFLRKASVAARHHALS